LELLLEFTNDADRHEELFNKHYSRQITTSVLAQSSSSQTVHSINIKQQRMYTAGKLEWFNTDGLLYTPARSSFGRFCSSVNSSG